jgi:hypothetical protein
MRVGSAFVFGRLVGGPAGRKYLCEGQAKERAAASLKVLNQTLAELARAFDAELSRYVVGAYQQLLAAPEFGQVIADCLTDELRALPVAPQLEEGFRGLVAQLKAHAARVGKR